MTKTKRVVSSIMCAVLFALSALQVYAVSAQTTVAIDNVTADKSEDVTIPIRISNNTGICGATISISYDADLVLKDIDEGEALSTLTITKPGSLSANPVNIVWDGLDADHSNGVIASLIFTVPDKPGTYNINVSYEDGDIVDGNLYPVDVILQNGSIKVSGNEDENSPLIINIADKSVHFINNDTKGIIIIAFYNEKGRLISLNQYSPSNGTINAENVPNAANAKILWWDSYHALQPVCTSETINLN